MKSRLADLMRQGFMKPRKRRAMTAELPIVARIGTGRASTRLSFPPIIRSNALKARAGQ